MGGETVKIRGTVRGLNVPNVMLSVLICSDMMFYEMMTRPLLPDENDAVVPPFPAPIRSASAELAGMAPVPVNVVPDRTVPALMYPEPPPAAPSPP